MFCFVSCAAFGQTGKTWFMSVAYKPTPAHPLLTPPLWQNSASGFPRNWKWSIHTRMCLAGLCGISPQPLTQSLRMYSSVSTWFLYGVLALLGADVGCVVLTWGKKVTKKDTRHPILLGNLLDLVFIRTLLHSQPRAFVCIAQIGLGTFRESFEYSPGNQRRGGKGALFVLKWIGRVFVQWTKTARTRVDF